MITNDIIILDKIAFALASAANEHQKCIYRDQTIIVYLLQINNSYLKLIDITLDDIAIRTILLVAVHYPLPQMRH